MSNIPEFTASTSVPRIAAIEHPFGRLLGKPGDSAGQKKVLEGVLEALVSIEQPGDIVHLPMKWPKSDGHITDRLENPPPIATYLRKNIRFLPRFVRRDIPAKYRVGGN